LHKKNKINKNRFLEVKKIPLGTNDLLKVAPNQLLNVGLMASQEAPHCCANACARLLIAAPKLNSTTLNKLLTSSHSNAMRWL